MSDFDWDEANIAHIRRHGVKPNEAEEAFLGSMDMDCYEVEGELRFENVGPTATGRLLTVITTDRNNKIRVVTAFDAGASDRRAYSDAHGDR